MVKKKERQLDAIILNNMDFIEAYIVCMNGTQAWQEAHPNTETNVAASSASRLLRSVKIKEYLESRFREMTIGKNEVLKRLRDIANATLFPFIKVEDDGHVYFNFADSEAKKYMYLVRKLKSKKQESSNEKTGQYTEERWIEVELHDAMKAIELIGKYHALFTEKVVETEKKVIIVKHAKEDDA